jgi:D-alanyl-D-alanine carboxypeptidase/D-alanyl-D-alanine-endopeptidase (penicillin-binding protein 4)
VPEGDVSHSGRRLRRITAGLVALLLVCAVAAFEFQLGPRWFGFDYPSPVTHPAEVAPPPGLSLPAPRPPSTVAQPHADEPGNGTAVRQALAALVRSKPLGSRVAVQVGDLDDGTVVYRHGPELVTPASTMKLLTSAAALSALGPDHRFTTRVVTGSHGRSITLVGGGDPLLEPSPVDDATTYPQRADLQTLARATAKTLKDLGRSTVRLTYDATLFTGPSVSPYWRADYVRDDVVSPVSALWVDEGRERAGYSARSTDPSAAAAQVFAAALAGQHVKVVGKPRPAVAPPGAQELSSVRSAPLAQIVQHVLEVSDNEGAEVLARHAALAVGQPASFDGGVRAVRKILGGLGVDLTGARIHDGSGLSRRDRLHPESLLSVVETASAADHPELRAVVADLPVAGFTGSLAFRFETGDRAGPGMVRAKTGTLTGVHGLAGTVTTEDGAVLAFVAVADRVRERNTLAARAALDQIAAALAGCTCAATP